MNQTKVTLLAFRNTSAELLVSGMDFPTFFLPSDKTRDSEIAKEEIQKSSIIICFGQKPQIKNKICLELIAKNNDSTIATNFDIESFKEKLEQQIAKTIEEVSGSSNYKMNQVNTGVDKRSKKILAIVSDILSEKLAKPLVDDIIEEIVTVLNGKKD